MVIYVDLDSDGYVFGWGSTRGSISETRLELHKDHELFNSNIRAWKYSDGKLVFYEEGSKQLEKVAEEEADKPNAEGIISLAILELAEEIEKPKRGS